MEARVAAATPPEPRAAPWPEAPPTAREAGDGKGQRLGAVGLENSTAEGHELGCLGAIGFGDCLLAGDEDDTEHRQENHEGGHRGDAPVAFSPGRVGNHRSGVLFFDL